jgi:hypothetical protein
VLDTALLSSIPHSVTVQGSTVAVGDGPFLTAYAFDAAGADPLRKWDQLGSARKRTPSLWARSLTSPPPAPGSGWSLRWRSATWAPGPPPGGPKTSRCAAATRSGARVQQDNTVGASSSWTSASFRSVRRSVGFRIVAGIAVQGDLAYLAGSGLQVVGVSVRQPRPWWVRNIGFIDRLARRHDLSLPCHPGSRRYGGLACGWSASATGRRRPSVGCSRRRPLRGGGRRALRVRGGQDCWAAGG